SGNKLPDVDGQEATLTFTVEVLAVTDPIALSLKPGAANEIFIDEDNSFNLKDYLQVTFPDHDVDNNTPDFDGSEKRWVVIDNLAVGSRVTVGSKVYTAGANGQVSIDSKDLGGFGEGVSGALPDIRVSPPRDFSGDLKGIQVTVKAQDRDSDSPEHEADVEKSTVTLDLYVNPAAGDVTAGDQHLRTDEDTPVNFLSAIRVTDTGTGNEVITKVVFTLPEGWKLDQHASGGSGWSLSESGDTYTIEFDGSLTQAEREGVLNGFAVMPPAHSSTDATIKVDVTTVDTSTVNGQTVTSAPHTASFGIKVEVTPVAERVGQDSDADSTHDLTMTPGHKYSDQVTPAAEDE